MGREGIGYNRRARVVREYARYGERELMRVKRRYGDYVSYAIMCES